MLAVVNISPASTRFSTEAGRPDKKASIWSMTIGERLVDLLELCYSDINFSPSARINRQTWHAWSWTELVFLRLVYTKSNHNDQVLVQGRTSFKSMSVSTSNSSRVRNCTTGVNWEPGCLDCVCVFMSSQTTTVGVGSHWLLRASRKFKDANRQFA